MDYQDNSHQLKYLNSRVTLLDKKVFKLQVAVFGLCGLIAGYVFANLTMLVF